jgi:hypothetical protein
MAAHATYNFEVLETLDPTNAARPSSEEIAQLAYELWQQRGCPDGSPELDWFQAEQELAGEAPRNEPVSESYA